MKNKWIWITVIVLLVIIIIGCATNWFGLGKPKSSTTNNSTRLFASSELNKYTCPEGYSLYTNALNGHSICVKLSTGEIVQPKIS